MKKEFPYIGTLIDINQFCDKYRVNKIDNAFLWIIFPFMIVKGILVSLAIRKGFIGKIFTKVLITFKQFIKLFNFKFTVFTKQGYPILIYLSFDEQDFLAFFEALIIEDYLAPFDILEINSFVDAGANIGMASLFFLLNTTNIESALLVEANPKLIDRLTTNIKIFEDKQIIIENKLINGKSNQELQFYISPTHRGSHIIRTAESQKTTSEAKVVTVKSVSLSDLLDKHALEKVDLLKMDIEGAEFDILENDIDVFKRFKYLCMELHGSVDERNLFRDKIRTIGFKTYERKTSHPRVEIFFASRLSV